ncbi:MAG: amidohydrolase family protein [Candidatus Kapabacteria bacterium]|nr:amidohydrolase family protein [Candidatus Kapabacteria bacterium]
MAWNNFLIHRHRNPIMKRIVSTFFAFTLLFALMFAGAQSLTAQESFPASKGEAADKKPECYALTNVRIVVSPTSTIESGTVVIREGIIELVGAKITIPPDAVIYDLKGKVVYPSFIEMDSDYGMPAQPPPTAPQFGRRGAEPQYDSKTQGAYSWNESLKPEKQASAVFVANPKAADELRRLGFGATLSFQHDGIARGVAAFVSLGDGKENTLILKDRAAAELSLNRGSSRQEYPGSLMGVLALLRQTYLDGAWYKQARAQEPLKTETNLSLEAWNALQSLPQIMDVSGNRLNAFRADRVGDEAGVQYILRTYGDEYAYIEDVKKTQAPFITSLNFPLAYNLDDPLDALNVTLMELKNWELAPTNPAALEKAGVQFALTTAGLRAKTDFMPNLRTAIKYGLSKQQALAALTTVPAQLLKMADKIGTIEKGKVANLLVASGDIFEAETTIFHNWVQGKLYELANPANGDLRGTYTLSLASVGEYTLTVKGTVAAPQTELVQPNDTVKIPVTLDRTGGGNLITLRFAKKAGVKSEMALTGWIDSKTNGDAWSGKGQDEAGVWFAWSAKRVKAFEAPAPKPDTTNPLAKLGKRSFPPVEYGFTALPKQETVLIKNATLWTAEKDGVLKNTDIVLKGGKIAAIGKNLTEAGATIIDGTGKHVSPGIIDEHSHIALQAINESGQTITCEVREGDVLNPEDINIYRQLAGGVTTSHLLHGSANSIGGQTQIIKLRWGLGAEQLKFEGAPGFVKFALGENVKQANWGDAYNVRFPQTRMGVEQVFVDAFTRAREYEAEWKNFSAAKNSSAIAPRRDLELDALVEIINSKRLITCHSYVQSEITMLMRVTEQFGFRVNTFTHILEGYKVADKMKAHGANASSFSDWWAYKMEVADAIPYNGAILHAMGLNVAFNSDDAEMARRLNQEAAKAVKYGGVPEEEALKFVTLNPAKMLHIDAKVGSLKVGKDADVVLWSDNPLSIYARAEKTFVDGTLYYDRERDAQVREEIRQERARLTQAMMQAKKGGAPTQAAPPRRNFEKIHCDTIGEVGW